MNISPDGMTVRFKTEPEELFQLEQSGVKSNTVRILDYSEYQQLKKNNPKKIIIQYQQEIFLRTITNIYVTEDVLGKVIVIFSWTNEKHHHPIPGDTEPCASCKHSQSLDEPIYLRSGEKTTGTVTLSITEEETSPSVGPHSVPVEPGNHNLRPEEAMSPAETGPTSEEPPIDEPFVGVPISKETIQTLRNFRHGCTINYIVQELYDFYCTKHAEDEGPLHD